MVRCEKVRGWMLVWFGLILLEGYEEPGKGGKGNESNLLEGRFLGNNARIE